MSNENLIGRIHHISDFDGTIVEWKIADFISTIPEEQDTSYSSPFFTFSEIRCHLVLQQKTFRSDCYIRLHFQMEEKFGHNIICVVSVRNAIGRLEKVVQFTHETKDDSFDSKWQKLCKTSELKRRMEELLPAGILTIHFKVNREESPFEPITRFECLVSLCRDMKKLFKEKQNTDVAFKFKEREIQAHKNILVNRSEYFRTMFDYDNVVESQTGIITVDDIEPEVFQQVLSHIYCGEVEELSTENMFQLYLAADKYHLSVLKRMCMTFIKDNMSVEIFCDVYAIADSCGETALLQFCKDYFVLFYKHIMKTDMWKSFHEENTKLVFQLLHSIVEENGLKLPEFEMDACCCNGHCEELWEKYKQLFYHRLRGKCYRCQETGHFCRDCPEKGSNGNEEVCYMCGKFHHIHDDCLSD